MKKKSKKVIAAEEDFIDKFVKAIFYAISYWSSRGPRH